MGGIAETSDDEYGEPFDTVRAIIDRVKTEGDRAVLEYEEKFDKVALTALAVTEAEQAEAEASVGEELKKPFVWLNGI